MYLALINANPCPAFGCLNEATCKKDSDNVINTFKQYQNISCECKAGYTGFLCEHKLSCGNCKSEKCEGYQKCKTCPDGFEGSNCEAKKCHSVKMCKNDGKVYFYIRHMCC